MKPVLVKLGILALSGLCAAACSAVPTVTKERMTLGEANIEGMECRREKAMDTNIPRTVCASPEAWARYDAAAKYESDLAFQHARSQQNVGAFNRR